MSIAGDIEFMIIKKYEHGIPIYIHQFAGVGQIFRLKKIDDYELLKSCKCDFLNLPATKFSGKLSLDLCNLIAEYVEVGGYILYEFIGLNNNILQIERCILFSSLQELKYYFIKNVQHHKNSKNNFSFNAKFDTFGDAVEFAIEQSFDYRKYDDNGDIAIYKSIGYKYRTS